MCPAPEVAGVDLASAGFAQYGGMRPATPNGSKNRGREYPAQEISRQPGPSTSTCSRRSRRGLPNPRIASAAPSRPLRANGSGSRSAEPAPWWACTLHHAFGPAADQLRGGRVAGLAARSHRPARWDGAGQPRWPAERAGPSTTNASAGCGARKACGSRSAAEEAVDRHRCRCRGDVADTPERDLGDGLQFDTTADSRTPKCSTSSTSSPAKHWPSKPTHDRRRWCRRRLGSLWPCSLRRPTCPVRQRPGIRPTRSTIAPIQQRHFIFIDPGSPGRTPDRIVQRRVARRTAQRVALRLATGARVIIEETGRDYNANRPHSAHGDLTQPAEFALQWTTTHQPQVA